MKYLLLAFLAVNAFAKEAPKPAGNTERRPSGSKPWYYQCQFSPDFREDLGHFHWVWIPAHNGIAKDKFSDVNLAEQVAGTCVSTGGQNDKSCSAATIGGQAADCNIETIGKFISTGQ